MHPAKNNSDVLIIGGGASGLAAACICAQAGADTILLEKQSRVGRKLLATGNGRCNLMPQGEPVFFGDTGFAKTVLTHVTAADVRAFFEGLGLTLHAQEGRVYPACGQAAAVLDVLRLGMERGGHVRVMTDAGVNLLTGDAGAWSAVTASGDSYTARRVILAGGGSAAPKLGGGDDMYRLARALGLTVVAPRPALSQLVTDTEPIRGWSGLRVLAAVTLLDGDTPVDAAQGELLFTEYGVSGVCVMQLSRMAGQLLLRGRMPVLSIDFSPLLGLCPVVYDRIPPQPPGARTAACEALLRERARRLPPAHLLTGMLPRLMADRLGRQDPAALSHALTDYRLTVRSVRGFDHAQVTAGGVSTGQIDPHTMASRRHAGLYLAGEMLDVDGDCGGHNLLFAWASGILAARHACA